VAARLSQQTRRRAPRHRRLDAQQSRTETASKAAEIMDVNRKAVAETMRSHGVTHLIHGHTHRPAVHRFLLDNQLAARIVLGDWYEQGTILSWDDHGFRLRTLPDADSRQAGR
jgi:UDP-2,3-diacylglucosamine hydrolase